MTYAKAYAAAVVVVVVFAITQFIPGFNVPDSVTAALTVILTPLAVAIIGNKDPDTPTSAEAQKR